MSEPGFFAAALAGLLSFLSPCVLPLVPAYLSFISGSSVSELSAKGAKPRIFSRSILFSAGFTLAFTVLGIVFSGGAMFAGQAGASGAINSVGGLLVALLGLNLIFNFLKFLDTDTRFFQRLSGRKAAAPSAGPGPSPRAARTFPKGGSAFVLGLAFAAGWSPCIGPILASILLYVGREGNLLRSAGLLLIYSLGFAVPFLATGLFFDRLKPLLAFFKRRGNEVRIVSGIVLLIFGAAMALGSLGSVSSAASRWGAALLSFSKSKPFESHGIVLAALFALALPALLRVFKRRISVSTSIYLGILLLLAALEASGVFNLLGLLAGWLGYAGL